MVVGLASYRSVLTNADDRYPVSLISTDRNRRIATVETVMPEGVTPKGARGRILNAALHQFASQGYGGTSVRDICAEAKVQVTTLYSHFPSKEHVLAEVIRLGNEEHFRLLRNALLESDPEPRKQLRNLVRAHVLSHCEFSMLAVVASSEMHSLSEELATPIIAIRSQSQSLLAEVFKRGIRLGLFDVPDIELACRAIGGMGLRVAFWYEPNCGKSADEVADSYAEFALRIAGLDRSD